VTLRVLGGKTLTREDIAANGTVSTLMDQYTMPELTANITGTYSLGPWSLQLQGRHISSENRNRNWVEGVDVDSNKVPSSTWWNGTLRYSSELQNGGSWNVGFNVLNMFDKNPPIIPSSTGSQGVANQYDIFGRRYNLSLNLQF